MSKSTNYTFMFFVILAVVRSLRAGCFILFYFLVLQGIDDASCAGLKYLLLGAINKCLHNTKDAIQVLPGLIHNTMYRALKYEPLHPTFWVVGLINSIPNTKKLVTRAITVLCPFLFCSISI